MGLVRDFMNHHGVDAAYLHAWLATRSIARGLPSPVPDRGGFRVETNSATEIRRWVFPTTGPGLVELGRTITAPRHFLKLCGDNDTLRSALPDSWATHPVTYFMETSGSPPERPLAQGYRIEIARTGPVTHVRILSEAGDLAASGYAAETSDAFVYDRIVTDPHHRRKGLGHAVVAALHSTRRMSANLQLLVATEKGKALYTTMGWKTTSLYSTAATAEI